MLAFIYTWKSVQLVKTEIAAQRRRGTWSLRETPHQLQNLKWSPMGLKKADEVKKYEVLLDAQNKILKGKHIFVLKSKSTL